MSQLGASLLVELIIAATIIVAVYVKFGKTAAAATGAGLALVIAYLRGRAGAAQAAENRELKDEVRNQAEQASQVGRADAAADRVRVDNADPDKLRAHDEFERR